MDLKQKAVRSNVAKICVIGVILIAIVLAVSHDDSAFPNCTVNSPEDAAEFLVTLGWTPIVQEIQVQSTVLPEQFDEALNQYNELQLQQGCDLRDWAGKEITVYTIPLANYNQSEETVYATVIVCKSAVIGGDIHSAQLDGFMHTLR